MAERSRIVTRTCARCGRTERCLAGGIPAGWSLATEPGRVEYVCDICVRRNLRAIESKLPREYWDDY